MKKTLILSCSILGFTSLVSQVVVIRELAMSFYANEFLVGWILFCWLLGTAGGSVWGSGPSPEGRGSFGALASCHVLTALFFPSAIVLIRYGKQILGVPAGALPELFPSLIFSFVILVPLCGVLGKQFAVAAKNWVLLEPGTGGGRVVAGAYLWECLGFIVGGIGFSFALVFMNEFRVAAFVAVLNLTAALLVLGFSKRKKIIRWVVGLMLVLFPAWLFMAGVSLQQKTSQARFPNETLLQTRNTLHGNVSVTQVGAQYNFYQSGLLLGADRADLASEYLVHFPMLSIPDPQKVLLLGTGFNGPIEQILKYDPREVLGVEIDPELLQIAEEYLSADLKQALHDPRVKIRGQDPLDFLKSEGGVYDVIIANFPDPVSVLINRNYTEQFFRLVRAHLAPDGVFATHITFAASFMAPALEKFGSSVYATLGQVFPSVQVLPEDTLFFLASPKDTFSWNAAAMVPRLSGRGMRTDFVTADLVRDRLENDRVGRVTTAFRNSLWKTKNTDLRPRACYFAFLRWLSQFDPGLAQNFFLLTQIPFPAVLGTGLFIVWVLASLAYGAERKTRRLALVSMGTAGFSLMALEVLGIYLFQAAFGNLYYRLAWVITAFMAGLGAGTWGAMRLGQMSERVLSAWLHAVSAAFFFILIPVCMRIFSSDLLPGEGFQVAFFGMAFLGGLVAGMLFPAANRLYLVKGRGERLASIYAADLGGSALGAFLTAGFLIPVWGVLQTLIFLGAGNALLVLLFLFRKDLSGKDL